jgi:hypothetical protein
MLVVVVCVVEDDGLEVQVEVLVVGFVVVLIEVEDGREVWLDVEPLVVVFVDVEIVFVVVDFVVDEVKTDVDGAVVLFNEVFVLSVAQEVVDVCGSV